MYSTVQYSACHYSHCWHEPRPPFFFLNPVDFLDFNDLQKRFDAHDIYYECCIG
jgi:hypothetical protein